MKVLRTIRNYYLYCGIGIALYHGHEQNYSELFKKAYTALYQAKASPESRFTRVRLTYPEDRSAGRPAHTEKALPTSFPVEGMRWVK